MRWKLIQPNGENATLEEVERACRCTPSASAAKRLQAIHALLRGVDRKAVAQVLMYSDSQNYLRKAQMD